MDELIYYPFEKMPDEDLRIWLDFSYKWHDEAYIKAIKNEFKTRGLTW